MKGQTNILLCTLGATWAVIPEVYAFLAPERLPLYRRHPDREAFSGMLRDYGLLPPDEIWILTTQGARTGAGLQALSAWHAMLDSAPALRIWQAHGTDELASQGECAHMQELTLRACLAAHAAARGGQVVLSLAGGRKTMSADLQWAGSVFGCRALVHVVGKEPLPEGLRQAAPETFIAPLSEAVCPYVLPLVAGAGRRSELLDVDLDGRGAVSAARFPLPQPLPGNPCPWPAPERGTPRLCDEIREREREGSQLLGNYLIALGESERHENWRSLYRLTPGRIDKLRRTTLTAAHADWLQAIPKADLHRHLGGCLDLPAQREVGRAVWDALTAAERRSALDAIEPLLSQAQWPWDWPDRLRRDGLPRAHAAAALLTAADDVQLRHNLFDATEPRVGLKSRHPRGFAAYERPGELSGSALLGHRAAIEAYARCVVRQAVEENLAYVEWRGSPQKYRSDFLPLFHRAVEAEVASLPQHLRPRFRFIVIADRRHPTQLSEVIAMAVAAKREFPDFVAGLDLAGDEGAARPAEIDREFLPAFEACLPITIHAGEGESAESIWQAAYHLHADRIGHGLTIGNHESLAARFRDRGICLELCPTSNREVVGFRDPGVTASADCPDYPLWDLWQSGLPLTLCTDNPGTSRTTLTGEYLTAARMVGDAFTLWDALAMIKQAFVHAFLSGRDKERLIKAVDGRIYRLMAGETDRWTT